MDELHQSVLAELIAMSGITISNADLNRAQAERELLSVQRQIGFVQQPLRGWVQTARTATGTSRKELAKRVGKTPDAIRKVEKSEVQGSVTVNKLREIAEALDCELKVAFVPKSELVSSLTSKTRREMRERAERYRIATALPDPRSTIESSQEKALARRFGPRIMARLLEHELDKQRSEWALVKDTPEDAAPIEERIDDFEARLLDIMTPPNTVARRTIYPIRGKRSVRQVRRRFQTRRTPSERN